MHFSALKRNRVFYFYCNGFQHSILDLGDQISKQLHTQSRISEKSVTFLLVSLRFTLDCFVFNSEHVIQWCCQGHKLMGSNFIVQVVENTTQVKYRIFMALQPKIDGSENLHHPRNLSNPCKRCQCTAKVLPKNMLYFSFIIS